MSAPLPDNDPGTDFDLGALRSDVLTKLAAEASPTQAKARRSLVVGVVAAVAAMGGVLAMAGIHLGDRPMVLVLGTLAGALALAGLALWLALGLGRSMLGRPLRLLVVGLLAIPVLLFVWKSVWSSIFPDMTDWDAARPGFRCLGWSLAMGLFPTTVFLWFRRHTAPRHPGALGAALGMATGASSWALLDLYCPIGHPGHLLLGHVLPMALLAGLGALVGRFLCRVR